MKNTKSKTIKFHERDHKACASGCIGGVLSAQTKMSSQTQRVLDLLHKEQRPLSAYEILDRLRRFGIKSPPTIYRALEALQKKGLVHRLESLNAFVVCRCKDQEAKPHQSKETIPFVICASCGQVDEVKDDQLTQFIQKISTSFLAHVNKGVLEVTGTCHACSKAHSLTS